MVGPVEGLEYKTQCNRLARRFREGAKLVEQLAPRIYLHLEPSAVHDLRVATRRMRAAVWAARRVGPLSSCKRLRKRLRIWGQALGERRMLDVVLQDAAELGLDASTLAERHGLAADAVRQTITPDSAAEVALLLYKAATRVSRCSERRLHQGLILCAQALHRALREAPGGKEHQHLLRIEAKKTRYVLELVGRKCEPLKDLQGFLGRSHDMETLQTLLGPHPQAQEIEDREREKALQVMKQAVHQAEHELRDAASALRGGR